jgi:hypothetical protein
MYTDGYRYIDAPCFSYANEDCCMKSKYDDFTNRDLLLP